MVKKIAGVIAALFIYLTTFNLVFASQTSFVSIVNPVRGGDYWSIEDQYPQTAVLGQIDILKKYNLSATWLVRFDALNNRDIIDSLDTVPNDEKGLFLEITPAWSKDAGVNYRQSTSWHSAGSAFLTGYERGEREKLIDTAFKKFKDTFGFYPKSVGAWWIDGYSLEYMQKKYGISASLIVADQYTTDNYQIWGQYWSTPYYPSKKDALNPASTKEDKLPVVVMQWAARDPVNAYGNGVGESTLSVQANDYTDYHNLNTSYFSKLVDIYTNQPLNQFGHLVSGLENSYSWTKYKKEYENQIKTLSEKNKKGQFSIVTMEEFANWYKSSFPQFSPPQIIVADDPLGSSKKSVWFMNPYYRVGWLYGADGSVIRDIRQYIDGEEEICYQKSCSELNFATFATRVLDDVTYHTKWIIDEGKISDFKVFKNAENYTIGYINEAGKVTDISFLPRDLNVNGKISSIDGSIMDALARSKASISVSAPGIVGSGKINFPVLGKLIGLLEFIAFVFFAIFLPGYFITGKIQKDKTYKEIFLSIIIGLVLFTTSFYLLSIFKLRFLIFIYPALGVLLVRRVFKKINFKFNLEVLPVAAVTILGTVFQVIPVFKSGLKYDFGIGFWGPNTHDGVWHIALIEQLLKSVPPQNPILAATTLKNYHYFYDLLIGATSYITRIDVLDLVLRFYPVLFSLALGLGSYYLCSYILQGSKVNKYWASTISLFLVYFSGSLGWIVEYITQKHFGGESAFWANQAISFNLNPPFAISLLIMIGIILLVNTKNISWTKALIIILLAGTLVGFKAYGGVLIITALLVTGTYQLIVKKDLKLILIFIFSSALSGIYILTNGISGTIFQFAPFWFINSMIDSPDRVGWSRLSLARYVAIDKKEWFKFIGVETVGFLIFLIGNLNLRIVGLIKIFDNFFIGSLALIALIIPLLFIQAGTPWNTIQFFYYFMYLCAVLSGPVLISVIKSRYKYIAIPVFLLLLASPINSWASANGYLTPLPHARISNLEFEGLEFLSKQPDGIVLTVPFDKNLKSQIREPWPISVYDTTAYVAAFAKKAVYVEDESQNDILLTDYKKRLIAAKDFFMDSGKGFLSANKIKYIYIPKLSKVFLDESSLPVTKIFDNDEVAIFRVNQ